MDIEKEEKCDDRTATSSHMANNNKKAGGFNSSTSGGRSSAVKQEPLTIMKTLIGDCLCQGAFPFAERGGFSQNSQFINIHGIEFIGLGAVIDELTPKERVYDTLEQLTTRTERLISIGYLSVEDPRNNRQHSSEPKILLETVPLDVWNKTYPNDVSMSRRLKRMINNIRSKEFDAAIADFTEDLKAQRNHPTRGNNKYIVGITAHNLGVLHVLAGKDDESIPLFVEAIDRKRSIFGPDHPEVAVRYRKSLFSRQRILTCLSLSLFLFFLRSLILFSFQNFA